MSHTPGPWKSHGFRVYHGELDGGLERTVADCSLTRIRGLERMSSEEFFIAQDNAFLIAAAPELLAACEEACSALSDCDNINSGRTEADYELRKKLETLIRKAKKGGA